MEFDGKTINLKEAIDIAQHIKSMVSVYVHDSSATKLERRIIVGEIDRLHILLNYIGGEIK